LRSIYYYRLAAGDADKPFSAQIKLAEALVKIRSDDLARDELLIARELANNDEELRLVEKVRLMQTELQKGGWNQ
jgi:hypothetical protein